MKSRMEPMNEHFSIEKGICVFFLNNENFLHTLLVHPPSPLRTFLHASRLPRPSSVRALFE